MRCSFHESWVLVLSTELTLFLKTNYWRLTWVREFSPLPRLSHTPYQVSAVLNKVVNIGTPGRGTPQTEKSILNSKFSLCVGAEKKIRTCVHVDF